MAIVTVISYSCQMMKERVGDTKEGDITNQALERLQYQIFGDEPQELSQPSTLNGGLKC
jgi:hypothetical protein